jgi:adenylate kinase family enzyme
MKIFIFGPSCGGKSTLSKALEKKLGPQWTRIDRDDLIEQGLCSDEEANRLLDKKIQNCFIVDAQIPWRTKQEDELYFLVLPPLEILLQRDAQRTKYLERSVEQEKQARKYVIRTHTQLNKMSKESFDECLDSSQMSLDDEIFKIQAIMTKSLKNPIC